MELRSRTLTARSCRKHNGCSTGNIKIIHHAFHIPDFGKYLAIDGKAIQSLANGKKSDKAKDCRSDHDADWGTKVYKGKNKDGSNYQKVVSWFGYKLYLVVNSRIDVSFGFENHYIRGLEKMKTRCGLALCIMLTLAYGWIMEDQKPLMRSRLTGKPDAM